MATPDECADDIFQPGGRLRLELLTPSAIDALKESLRLARDALGQPPQPARLHGSAGPARHRASDCGATGWGPT